MALFYPEVTAMLGKKILDPTRVRKIQGSFSWVDHRLITGGFLADLSSVEILLYLFLVAVSDRFGISFYHQDKIASLLKIDLASLGKAREGLIQRSLLAYEPPLYQILSLPVRPVTPLPPEEIMVRQRQAALQAIRKIQEAL
jgi:hypothetical protein